MKPLAFSTILPHGGGTLSVKNVTAAPMGSDASLATTDGTVKLRMIVDRGSVEVFANQGEITVTKLFYPDRLNMDLELSSKGGTARITAMEAYRLRSIWLKREQELGYFRDSA